MIEPEPFSRRTTRDRSRSALIYYDSDLDFKARISDDTLFRLCSGTISGRHERWEFDSGARDLSPEPHTLQKLVEAAAGGTGNMLDLANKVSD